MKSKGQARLRDIGRIAFLDHYPTVYGKVLVAPKAYVEHVVRELGHEAFLALLAVVHRVARAVAAPCPVGCGVDW